jgi:uncharacterized protein DUF4332
MRIKGVGSEYADLLEAAGVDTVPALGQRNAAKNLVRRVPTAAEVEAWVAEAKTLPRAVEY